MYDICCIGHITHDKVVTPEAEAHMAGGTSYYFSNAIANMSVQYRLITAVAPDYHEPVYQLRGKGIQVQVLPSRHTVYFENIYGANRDERTQRVLSKADPFTAEALTDCEARFFHLGPLLADDMSPEFIRFLSKKGQVSLDVQGFLREVRDEAVYAVDWIAKDAVLPYINILKANESEAAVLTGCTDIREAAVQLSNRGVKEILITLGSHGSLIYADGVFTAIPVCTPSKITDTTGCGDTYMAGYLYKRSKGAGPAEAGLFASAIAGLKTAEMGPFTGTEQEVDGFLETSLH